MNCLWSLSILMGYLSPILVAAFEDEETNCFALHDNACPNANISFWLYTKSNPQGKLLSLFTIRKKDFLPLKPLRLLIHGFNGNRSLSPNAQLRHRLLDLEDNVISLDYQKLAYEPCYSEAVHNAKYVGQCIAHLLTMLLDNELVQSEDIHLIGFGLGAHVAGFAGNFLSNNKLEHITALDPAKPLYLVNDTAQKLDPSDAKFVDVIHTDVMMLGLLDPVGHVDFYLNMGVTQPNCGPVNEMDTHYCYHNRAADYYGESIASPTGFYGFYCPNFKSYASGLCVPKKDIQLMGINVEPEARGRYFMDTNNSPPYAKGHDYSHLNRELKGRTYMNDDIIEKLFEGKA
ncbi:pancreatic lipase-related protein 2 [Drosophila eugracilis]|uniref:pancreatic lipase-related protein 2 n=1 Tax=Drosophila eugracilis TaxID=29029 RepID=UPI001BDB2BCA|nr:pancreatic lipase-related protein 2 [Drosophila eugracilis]